MPNPEGKRCVVNIDGDRTNNHHENLRAATHSENSRNRKKHSDGSSAYQGVSYYKRTNKWRARIAIHEKHTFLGYFESEREAAEAYNAAAALHYGEFAKVNTFND